MHKLYNKYYIIAVHLAEKAWLPLQPPIPFPSPDRYRGHHDEGEEYRDSHPKHEDMEFHFHDDQDELHHHEPTMGHASTTPPRPPTGHGRRHQHTEL